MCAATGFGEQQRSDADVIAIRGVLPLVSTAGPRSPGPYLEHADGPASDIYENVAKVGGSGRPEHAAAAARELFGAERR